MSRFQADLDGVTFTSNGCKLVGGFYKAAGDTPRPTAILIHGIPGVEKNLDIAYALRDLGWNCLYFHFRGSWGSEGSYSLLGLTDDTQAAVEWVMSQPSVNQEQVVLIGSSVGFYPALLHGAVDSRIRAIVGISPLIDPHAFALSEGMADQFANMLHGVTGQQLRDQWQAMVSLTETIKTFSPRPLLIVTADQDDIFPPSHYTNSITKFSHVEWIREAVSDHGFSTRRRWLVETVVNWLTESQKL